MSVLSQQQKTSVKHCNFPVKEKLDQGIKFITKLEEYLTILEFKNDHS